MTIVQAMLLAGWHYLAYATFRGEIMHALPAALVAGIVLGDIPTCMMIGASVQIMYIAFTGAGGNVPNDEVGSTIMCCAVAVASGAEATQSIVLAVPIALLCGQLVTAVNALNSMWVPFADRAAKNGDTRKITLCALVFPNLLKLVIMWLPMTIVLRFGTDLANQIIAAFPEWVNNGLAVLGGALPALGVAILTNMIGQKKVMPFFFAGYFFMAYSGVSMIALTMLGLFLAFIYYLMISQNKQVQAAPAVEEKPPVIDASVLKGDLKYKDLVKIWCRWYWAQEQSLNYERMQAIAFCYSIAPRLKKLYADDEAEYCQALQRHLEFYNSECVWGATIHGIVLALEEEHASGEMEDTNIIVNVKTSMMGSFSALGDTIGQSMLSPLLLVSLVPLAAAGHWYAGVLYPIIFFAYRIILGTFFMRQGYQLGIKAATQMLASGAIKMISECAGVLGLFMMGGIGATYVTLSTPLKIPTSGTPLELQSQIFDAIAPGIIPLAAIVGIYYLVHKGVAVWKVLVTLVVVGFVCGALGILA